MPGALHRPEWPQRIWVVLTAIGLLGMSVNVYAYGSLLPVIAAILLLGAGLAGLSIPRLGGTAERAMFLVTFLVYTLTAGVAAVYVQQWGGHDGFNSASFYRLAIGGAAGLDLEQIQRIHAGPLAIVAWQYAYELFSAIGVPKAPFVGVLINAAAVSLSGVLAIKMTRTLYGDDFYRFRRMTILFSACGLFWLYASTHLRDGIVLLAVTFVCWGWVKWLMSPRRIAFVPAVVLMTLVASVTLSYLRSEFEFIPIGLAMLAIASVLLEGGGAGRLRGLPTYAALLVAAATAVVLGQAWLNELSTSIRDGSLGYLDLAERRSGVDSLGVSLVLSQPLPIRLAFGSVYIFLAPIPVWSGIQLESAYYLFKSANAIFFYALLPLIVIAASSLIRARGGANAGMRFLWLTGLSGVLVVVASSMESRHLGAFLVPVFLIALLPDLRKPEVRRSYSQLLVLTIIVVVAIHAAWAVLKFA